MLNKETCKRCNETLSAWRPHDDTFWEQNLVWCLPMGTSGGFIVKGDWVDVKGEVPDNCLCKLEHLIMGQKNE